MYILDFVVQEFLKATSSDGFDFCQQYDVEISWIWSKRRKKWKYAGVFSFFSSFCVELHGDNWSGRKVASMGANFFWASNDHIQLISTSYCWQKSNPSLEVAFRNSFTTKSKMYTLFWKTTFFQHFHFYKM